MHAGTFALVVLTAGRGGCAASATAVPVPKAPHEDTLETPAEPWPEIEGGVDTIVGCQASDTLNGGGGAMVDRL